MRRAFSFLALAAFLALPAVAADAPKPDSTKKEDAAIQQIDQQIAKANVDKSNANWRTSLPKPEKVTFDAKHKYYALMETTKGKVKIEFLPDVAPMHVTNFIYLSRLGFYDGLAFHRVINGFMAQGGCPLGTGTGGPGYQFGDEFSSNRRHDGPGVLSMANAGANTNGSQFFITFGPTPHLDGKHSVFGRVTEGMDVLKSLRERDPGRDPAPGDRIERIEITESPAG